MPELLAPLRQWAAGADPDGFWWLCTLLAAATLGSGWLGFRRLKRARLIEDTPTQRLRSAAQGYVELEGAASTRWASSQRSASCSQSSEFIVRYRLVARMGGSPRVTDRSLCDTPLRRNLRVAYLEKGVEL